YKDENWTTVLQKVPSGEDKVARAMAAVPVFANGMVFAPAADSGEQNEDGYILFRAWAQMVIDEIAMFPKGRHDDLTNAMVQAVRSLRRWGYAKMPEEVRHIQESGRRFRPRPRALYPGMRAALR